MEERRKDNTIPRLEGGLAVYNKEMVTSIHYARLWSQLFPNHLEKEKFNEAPHGLGFFIESRFKKAHPEETEDAAYQTWVKFVNNWVDIVD